LKCLRKEPKRRYESAQALTDDLTRYLEHRPILARPVSRPERAWRWCRRRPALATALSALAATVLFSLLTLQTLYAQAVAQRDRAEAALEREVKNRQLASTLIGSLGQIVSDTVSDRPLHRVPLVDYARVLRDQIATARRIPGFEHANTSWPIEINKCLADELVKSRRWVEARLVLRDWIEYLRDRRVHEPGNRNHLWKCVEAHMLACTVEAEAGDPDEALRCLDRAAVLVISAEFEDSFRPGFTARVSAEYKHFLDRLAAVPSREQVNHIRSVRNSLFALLDPGDSDHSEAVLLRACLLADNGDWNRAQELADTVIEGLHSVSRKSIGVRESLGDLLGNWLRREFRHWDDAGIVEQTAPPVVGPTIDRVLVLISNFSPMPELGELSTIGFAGTLQSELGRLAAVHRKAGRRDQASRIVAFYSALAQALVRQYPESASWSWFLARAYMQQSKNAWQTKNMPAIKAKLEKSVETLKQAVFLDPNIGQIRRDLLNHTARLANLPRS
jgi:tetratricopeptide (TPR) repeat protein